MGTGGDGNMPRGANSAELEDASPDAVASDARLPVGDGNEVPESAGNAHTSFKQQAAARGGKRARLH